MRLVPVVDDLNGVLCWVVVDVVAKVESRYVSVVEVESVVVYYVVVVVVVQVVQVVLVLLVLQVLHREVVVPLGLR